MPAYLRAAHAPDLGLATERPHSTKVVEWGADEAQATSHLLIRPWGSWAPFPWVIVPQHFPECELGFLGPLPFDWAVTVCVADETPVTAEVWLSGAMLAIDPQYVPGSAGIRELVHPLQRRATTRSEGIREEDVAVRLSGGELCFPGTLKSTLQMPERGAYDCLDGPLAYNR